MTEFEATRAFAHTLDDGDPLRDFREEFNIPASRNGQSCIYLCGNSLGLQPKRAARYVREELEDWADLGVEGHLHARRPWLPYHRLAVDGLVELAGGDPQEIVAMNTLTVNLHLMMATFYRPQDRRHKIVIESTAFPSDRFAVMSQLRWHGYDPAQALIEWTPRDDDVLYVEDLERVLEREGDTVALMLLPGVQYYSGQVLPMRRLCEIARTHGCRIGLDLAHAIGNVPLELGAWAPDFAAWCSYKYLNGGPGAIAGAFVAGRHLNSDRHVPLLGWWSHDEKTRFQMAASFTPAPGAELWQLSNPPILSLAPVIASLEVFKAAGVERLFDKSRRLTDYLDYLLQARFADSVRSITPADARGCQLSLLVQGGARAARGVFDTLTAQNVIADWREPNVIRVAPVPLYNRYSDVYEFAERLATALQRSS